MATRRPFWKWHRWKSIGFCLWPPSTCIWNLKLKFQSKLDLCSGNHVVYRQTDGQTDKVNPVYPPSNFVGRGYNEPKNVKLDQLIDWSIVHIFNETELHYSNTSDIIGQLTSVPRLKIVRENLRICWQGFVYLADRPTDPSDDNNIPEPFRANG